MKKTLAVVLALLISIVAGRPLEHLHLGGVDRTRRDFGSLLGDGDEPILAPTPDATTYLPKASHISNYWSGATSGTLGETSRTPASSTILSVYQTIGTEDASSSSIMQSSSTTSTATTRETVGTIAATNTSTPVELSDDPKSEWQVIGITIITVTSIATIAVLIIFFDKWWRFVLDVVVGKRRNAGTEYLVPDWENGCWKFEEDSHRYPSLPDAPVRQPSSRKHPTDLRHPFRSRSRPDPSQRFPQPSCIVNTQPQFGENGGNMT